MGPFILMEVSFPCLHLVLNNSQMVPSIPCNMPVPKLTDVLKDANCLTVFPDLHFQVK